MSAMRRQAALRQDENLPAGALKDQVGVREAGRGLVASIVGGWDPWNRAIASQALPPLRPVPPGMQDEAPHLPEGMARARQVSGGGRRCPPATAAGQRRLVPIHWAGLAAAACSLCRPPPSSSPHHAEIANWRRHRHHATRCISCHRHPASCRTWASRCCM